MSDDMTMVERVARVLAANEGWNFDQGEKTKALWMKQAKAAIEAMREPTDAMIKEGEEQQFIEDGPCSVYMAMIDAALKDA